MSIPTYIMQIHLEWYVLGEDTALILAAELRNRKEPYN